MHRFFCTVFTPTYNRATLLKRLYESLKQQTFQDFEWVVVDDGSTDDTVALVQSFVDEKQLSIKYVKVENGGKHRAINKGLELAEGEIFAIVDSDDYLTANALQKISEWFAEIEKENSKTFCGVAGGKGYDQDSMIGTTFLGEYVDATPLERKRYHITGDKFEVFYTDVLRKYPFPSFEGEKFMSEIVVWTRLGKDGYYIRWHQDIVYICDYLEDGLTTNNFRVLSNSPKGYALRIREQVQYADLSVKERWGYYSNYYFLLKKKYTMREICEALDVSCVEMVCAISMRALLMVWRGNMNEYKNV